MKNKILYIGALCCVFFVLFYLHGMKIEPFWSFSLKFNDVNFELSKKKINPDIVFVAVDEPSVNEFGRWPWKREILAKGVEKLSQANIVLFDMIFSEPTNKDDDEALSEAMSLLNLSVCGFFLRHKSTQKLTQDELDILSDSSLDTLQAQISKYKTPKFIFAKYAELNIPKILSSCTMSGSFSTLSQKDHLLRTYPVAVYFDDMLYPSLGVQALRLIFDSDIKRLDTLHVDVGGRVLPLDENGFVGLNFYHKNQYRIISFLDVANGKVKPDFFKDKIVILGITEVGAGDVASTPIGEIPGPLLHYTFLSNVLEGQLIAKPLHVDKALMFVCIVLPFMLIFAIKKILNRVIINVVSYLVLYILARYLFVTQSIYIDMFYPLLSLLVSAICVEIIAFNLQEKSSRFLKNAFSSYLSVDLLNELIKNPNTLKLGGEKKELSILFSDIRDFTSISESMDPSSLTNLLNRYFTPMTNAVLSHGGMLDKYIGDAIMAFFNAPVEIEKHVDAACRCALEMLKELDKLNIVFAKEGIKPLHIGIGINTAKVVVGNMGSDNRFNYTVIGDGVNLASRLEGLTKKYGVAILMTEFVVKKLKDDFLYREIERVQVKGKAEAVLVYELMPHTKTNMELKILYDKALNAYKQRDIHIAKEMFLKLADDYSDNVSAYFLNQIQDGHFWDVCKMDTK